MANKVHTYKFGQDELDMKKYLNNLDRNVQSYIQSLNWTQDLINEFNKSYSEYMGAMQDLLNNKSSRFYTDGLGTIYDSEGKFSNKDNPAGSEYYYDDKGNRITTDDYNLLKDSSSKGLFKKKRNHKDNYHTFNANLQVATYFNKIGNDLRDKLMIKPEALEKFSWDKFGQDWRSEFTPGQSEYTWDLLIDDDEFKDGVRGRTNRIAKLTPFIDKFIQHLDDNDYDYSESGLDKDTIKLRYTVFKEALQSGDWNKIVDSAREAGIDNKWLNNYLTDKEHVIDEGGNTQASDNDLRELAKQNGLTSEEDINRFIDQEKRKKIYETQSLLDSRDKELDDLEFNDWVSLLNVIKDSYLNNYSLTNNNVFGPWAKLQTDKFKDEYGKSTNKDEFMRSLLPESILATRDQKLYYLNASKLRTWASTNAGNKINGTNEYFLPWTINTDTQTVLSFDNNSGRIKKRSILNIDNDNMKKYIRNYWQSNIRKHQQGGTINFYSDHLINPDDAIIAKRENAKKAAHKAKFDKARKTNDFYGMQITNRTKDLIEAGMKETNLTGSAEDVFSSLSGHDLWRIGNAVADVVSAGSAYVPVYGTAISAGTGLASTLSTLAADATDDSVSVGSTLKNFGANLGADVLGLIPGFGTASKATKIAKILKPVSKALMTGLTALNTDTALAGATAIGRIINDPSKATKDDITAALRGLLVVVGKGGKQVAAKRKLKQNTKKITQNFTVKGPNGKAVTLTKDLVDQIQSAADDAAKNKLLAQFLNTTEDLLKTSFLTRGRNGSWNPLKWDYFNTSPTFKSNDYTYLRNRSKGKFLSDLWWYRQGLGFRAAPRAKKTLKVLQQALQQALQTTLQNSPLISNMTPSPFPQPPLVRPMRLNGKLVLGAFKKGGTLNLNKVKNYHINFNNSASAETNRRNIAFAKIGVKLSELSEYDPTNDAKYDTSTFVNSQYGNSDRTAWGTPGASKLNQGRYLTTQGWTRDQTRLIESQELYDKFTNELFTTDANGVRTVTPLGELYMRRYDELFDPDSELRFYDLNGKLRLSWAPQGKDIDFNVRTTPYTNAADRIYDLRRDGNQGPAHNTFMKKGTRYFYMKDGRRVYVNPNDIEGYDKKSLPKVIEGDTEWNDYELSEKINPSGTKVVANDQKPLSKSSNKYMMGMFDNNPLFDETLKMIYENIINDKLTKMAIENERPVTRNHSQILRRQFGNLRALREGEQAAANLMNQANNFLTADEALRRQMLLLAAISGNDARFLKQQLDLQTQHETAEQAWQQEAINLAERNEDANFNRQSFLETLSNKGKHRMAGLALKAQNIVGRIDKGIYDKEMKKQEIKDLEYQQAYLNETNNIYQNPTQYGFSDKEAELLKRMRTGDVSTFTPEEKLLALDVKNKLTQLDMQAKINAKRGSLNDILSIFKKTPSKYDTWHATLYDKKGGKLKDGSKIKVAKVRERISNGNRFQRGMLEFLKRHLKNLDRLSKSMYSYPKLK